MRPLAAALPGFPAANVLYLRGRPSAKADNAGNVHQFQVPVVGSMRLSGQPEQLRCDPNFPLHPHVRPCLRPALVPGPVPPPAVRQGWRLVVWYTGISCVFVFCKKSAT